jgi:hypothetical protein
MARAPSAGSAYTYVGKELHPALGYLTGWSMLMDYILNPIICTIWCSKAAMNVAPEVPYAVWAVFFAALFTGLNLRGIRHARTNRCWSRRCASVAWFFAQVARFVRPAAGGLTRPFYDPSRSRGSCLTDSLAALT